MNEIPKGSFLPLRWDERPIGARHGEGISRPKDGAKTREYRLMITLPTTQPMLWITKAESKRHAIKYAKARWPECEVEVKG